jgi:hypothetical protein
VSATQRRSARIGDALTGDLKAHYDAQYTAVRQFAAPLDEATATGALRGAMSTVFVQAFGLGVEEGDALARLACEMPPMSDRQGRVGAMVERCSLQRALAAAGMAGDVAPYLRAAARGAVEGFKLDQSLVLTARPGDRARPNIPSLPPIHHQKTGAEHAKASPLFNDPTSGVGA